MTIDLSKYKALYLETARKLIEEYVSVKSSSESEYAVQSLLRIFHSLKGQSMAMGYMNSAELFLQSEKFCRTLNENKIPMDGELKKLLPSPQLLYDNLTSLEKTNTELPLLTEKVVLEKEIEKLKNEHISILVAEDDPFFQKTCMDNLREKSILIDFANDGEDAIAHLAAKKYNCVLLDIIMPKKNGFDVLQFAKDNGIMPKTPIIIFSTLGQEENVQKALAMGAVDFITKAGLDYSQLLPRVKQAIAKNKLI